MPYTSDEIDRKLKRRFQRRKLTLKDAANFDMNFINRLCETITTGSYYTVDTEREDEPSFRDEPKAYREYEEED